MPHTSVPEETSIKTSTLFRSIDLLPFEVAGLTGRPQLWPPSGSPCIWHTFPATPCLPFLFLFFSFSFSRGGGGFGGGWGLGWGVRLGCGGVSWPSLKMSLKFKKKRTCLLNRDRLRLGLCSCARIFDDWEACPRMQQKEFGWWWSGLQARYWEVGAVEEWRWGSGGGRGLEDSKMSPWRVIVNRWKKFACFPKRVRLVLACARFYT